MSKDSPNQQQTFVKSPIYLTLVSLFILAALYPHESSQQSIISKSSIIQATCNYKYSSNNIYTCDLTVSAPVTSSDVLEIAGTHLENHTDADVEAFLYHVKFNSIFNGEALRKFENLKSFSLIGESLLGINQNAFDVCSKLERLVINYGRLINFPSGMLKNCKNLISFEVMGSQIETFSEDFFGNTSSLEEFGVSLNRLTSLPEKLLYNMEKLKSIRIGYNKLRELSPNFLINSPNLAQFSAYVNEFRDQGDIAYALNGKINLKHLWIDENNFTSFDFRFFAQFQKLVVLSVGMRRGSKLTDIHWQSLPASLTDLQICGIGEEIPENAFERVTSLITLTLYGKDFTSFQKDLFKPLTNLLYLYIYESALKTLHPELFLNQINLVNLMIRGSQIEELPPGIFASLVNIGIWNINGIQITSSRIRRLNSNSFGQHPYLQKIDFRFNDINEIERGIFSKFHPNITYAGFSDNECVNQNFEGGNLDSNENLEQCYKNWEEIDPNNTSTPGGCGRNFKSFEIFAIIFVGIFKVLFNFVN